VVITPDYLQAIRVWIRQRPQQHGVHDGEERGGGADAERKREYDDQRKAGLFS
jgi:hypothetical protein